MNKSHPIKPAKEYTSYKNWMKKNIIKPIKRSLKKFKNKFLRFLPPQILQFIVQKALQTTHPIKPIPGNIVLLCGSLQPGGAERQVVNTLNELKHESFNKVILLCENLNGDKSSGSDFYLSAAKESGWEIREVKKHTSQNQLTSLPKGLSLISMFVNHSLSKDITNLYNEFNSLRPEIVHSWLDGCNVKAGIAGILTGIPKIILSGRSYSPKNFALNTYYFHPCYSAIIKNPSVFLTNNSHGGACDYAKWLDIPENQIMVIRNGTKFHNGTKSHEDISSINSSKITIREKFGIPKTSKVVGGMFRFTAEKDPILWLDVAIEIAHFNPDVYFILYGDGSMKSDLIKIISNASLERKIFLYGHISDALYGLSICDTVLLTSVKEGTPNVLIEAQWLGIPVVSTDAGAAKEAVQNGITGFVSNSREPIEIANLVHRCLSDEEIINSAKLNGPKFINNIYGIDRMIKETLAVYNTSYKSNINNSK